MTTRPSWLITGAQGFLGANLGAYLQGKVTRIGAVRRPTGPNALYDRYIAADLENPEVLVDYIDREHPDVVLHAAAMASHEACEADPIGAERVNARASAMLSAAAARVGARFVLISTDSVFDGSQGRYTEKDSPNPFSVYGRTKLQAERLVAANSHALIIRTNFFGWSPTGRRSILEFFVNELTAGRRVRGFSDFTTSSAYTMVVADTIWQLATGGAVGVFHVASIDALTKYEFGVAVADAFGLQSSLITPTRAALEPARNRDLSLDVSKVQDWLGVALPTQHAGIEFARSDANSLRKRLAQVADN